MNLSGKKVVLVVVVVFVESLVESRPQNDAASANWNGLQPMPQWDEWQVSLMKSYMNISVDPCDDMYEFACGNFKKSFPLPDDENLVTAFSDTNLKIDYRLRDILEAINDTDRDMYKKHPKLIKPQAKMKRFYDCCMDLDTLEAREFEPILDLFANFGGWPILEKKWNEDQVLLEEFLAELNLISYGQLISVSPRPDPLMPDFSIIEMIYNKASDLSKADFDNFETSPRIRSYSDFIGNVVELFGVNRTLVQEDIVDMILFERQVYEVEHNMSVSAQKSFSDTFEKSAVGNLEIMFPLFDWGLYLSKSLGRPVTTDEEIGLNLNYLSDVLGILLISEKRTIVNWLLWKVLLDNMQHFDTLFRAEKSQYIMAIYGRNGVEPRWRTCLNFVKSYFGPVLGKLYIEEYFNGPSKEDVLDMTKYLQQAFTDLVLEKSWLPEVPKISTAAKVASMEFNVGYDEYILSEDELRKEYEDLDVNDDKFFENMISLRRIRYMKSVTSHGVRANGTISTVFPFTSHNQNILYRNRIETTVAFLQPPMYDLFFPKVLNYASVGFHIAHQMAHGVNEEGWSYNYEGFPKYFLDRHAINASQERSECFRKQYDQYVWMDYDIDADHIWREAVADSAGLKVAFLAYQEWYDQNVEPDAAFKEKLPGMNFSPYQLFFVRYAQMFCTNIRLEAMGNLLETDVRAYSPIRVIGALRNSEEFSQQFYCDHGMAMNPTDKCELW